MFPSGRSPAIFPVCAENGNAGQRWRTFLNNHQEVIAGMDFFTVITANFRILYCLFLIRHDRREILHFNSTQHPTSEWIVQQLRQAFPDRTDIGTSCGSVVNPAQLTPRFMFTKSIPAPAMPIQLAPWSCSRKQSMLS